MHTLTRRIMRLGPRRHVGAYGWIVAAGLLAFLGLVASHRASYRGVEETTLGELLASPTWVAAGAVALPLMARQATYAAGLWIAAAVLAAWGVVALVLGLQLTVSLAGPVFCIGWGIVAAQTAREADRRRGGHRA